MTDTLTLTGLVVSDARHVVTAEGLPITSFRLASTQRRFDRSSQRWIDGDTNWYTITAFRQLAMNSSGSIKKGERVIVSGRLRIREWENAERTGTTIEVEADAIGHDLSWGTSAFIRSVSTANRAASASVSTEPSASTVTSSTLTSSTEAFPTAAELAAVDAQREAAGEAAVDAAASPIPEPAAALPY